MGEFIFVDLLVNNIGTCILMTHPHHILFGEAIELRNLHTIIDGNSSKSDASLAPFEIERLFENFRRCFYKIVIMARHSTKEQILNDCFDTRNSMFCGKIHRRCSKSMVQKKCMDRIILLQKCTFHPSQTPFLL